MSGDESFEHAPLSIGEIRSQRSWKASDWTPREALVQVLRMIDSGEIAPDAITVCWRTKIGPGETVTGMRLAGPDIHTSLGLLTVAAHDIMSGSAAEVEPEDEGG